MVPAASQTPVDLAITSNRPNIICDQIDYILINKRCGSTVTRGGICLGADVQLDLRASMKTKIDKQRKRLPQKKISYKKLPEEVIRTAVSEKIILNLQMKIAPDIEGEEDITPLWK